jgi:hypothetical protein
MACKTCFSEKVAEAIELLKGALTDHSNPIVMSSFGKDSMVVLDLIKRVNRKLPILFFREPSSPKKYLFAQAMIHANDYVVYDYPPLETRVHEANGNLDIVSFYQWGPRDSGVAYFPVGTKPPRMDQPSLCGLDDIYGKPTIAAYTFPWDLAIFGLKSTDTDWVLGPCPMNTYKQEGNPALLFPLRDFTDADIWRYTIELSLPINEQRYNRLDDWKPFEDITFNPDYFHACTACMREGSPAEVFCPKVNAMIPSVALQVRRMQNPKLPAYILEKGA